MPSAGKGEFCNQASQLGIPVCTTGDVIREELRKRKMEITSENFTKIITTLIRKEGKTCIIDRLIPDIKKKLESSSESMIVVDGIRNSTELFRIKEMTDARIEVVAIHSCVMTRFKRILKRKRENNRTELSSIYERDQRNLWLGIGDVIALADHMIVNEGTYDEFIKSCRTLLINELGSESRH